MKTDDVDIRLLRYFLVLADELHFTRAAERIGIRQPPLSMQIRRLEEVIGAQLFHRLSRGTELTAAGRVFRDAAADIVARFDNAVVKASRHADGRSGRLRIGFAGATYFHAAVPELIRELRASRPDVTLSPEQSNTPALLTSLREGRIDVAFIRPPIDEDDLLSVRPFVDEAMVVALPADHALAQTGPVRLSELAGERLILFPRAIGPGLYDSVLAACHAAGFSPDLGQEASQIVSIIPMVAAGFGVSVIPRSVSLTGSEGVVYRPIAQGIPLAPIAVAIRADDHSALIKAFLATATRIAASR